MEDEGGSRARLPRTSTTSDEQASGQELLESEVTGGQPHAESEPSLQEQQHMMGSSARTLPLDMSNVAAALPEYLYRPSPQTPYQQQYSHHPQHSAMMYSYQGSQYPGAMQSSFPMQYPTQMPSHNFSTQRPFIHYPINPNIGAGQQIYHGQAYLPQQVSMTPSAPGSYAHTSPTHSYEHAHVPMYAVRSPSQYYGPQIVVDNFGNTVSSSQSYIQSEPQGLRRTSSATSLKVSSALRGPPRKPKQSGHALWVGNLPPGTNILDLKDHFSRDATDDIESVFLISKSNCAFVNYKSEQTCAAAMGRFHDSRFNGVRLVCRLRRGSSPTSATVPSTVLPGSRTDSKTDTMTTPLGDTMALEGGKQDAAGKETRKQTMVKERYFIIKSLTIEDLERSVHNGIWATQSHNEELLNQAYQTAENVYLVFSANKSGEYFGYARMDSAIDDESVTTVDVPATESQPPRRSIASTTPEIPLTIPTPATATAPKGYIIDDSARGTIFWEAELGLSQGEASGSSTSPDVADSDEEVADMSLRSPSQGLSAGPSSTFGKPFKITWVSTARLPFYRTRGLRNPWNTNREVKIARDGTELEPTIGKRLVSMFHTNTDSGRVQPQGQYPPMMGTIPGQGPVYRPF